MDRQALLPLQQPDGERGAARQPEPEPAEHRPDERAVGPLRPRLSARGHRQPLPFKTAQEHYEALLAETTKRGGPNEHTYKDVPADEWTGVYVHPGARAANNQNWYRMRAHADRRRSCRC